MPDPADDHGLTLHVGWVLRRTWDPIELGDQGRGDEYDSYVPDLVAMTRDAAVFEDRLIAHLAHLARIEVEGMCLSLPPARRTRAARALLGLREALTCRSGRLVDQRSSPDGLRCLWVFECDGLYTYEEGVLQHDDDENGRWSWWADGGLSRSGLFDTAEAAEREAHAVIGWLREGELAASASVNVCSSRAPSMLAEPIDLR